MNTAILRSRILDLAIHGQLVPQDPTEGSAAELLQDIAKQRGKAITPITDDVPFDIPESWKWVRLGDIAASNIGLTYHPQDVCSNGIPVYRSNNINNRSVVLDDIIRVNCKILQNEYLNNGDILICARNGSKRLVGKCALITNLPEPSSFGAFMAKCCSEYNEWIFAILNSEYFKRYLDDSNSTTIHQVTQKMLLNFPIPLPPLNEQQRIVSRVEELLKQVDIIEQAQLDIRQTATILRSKVLDKAIHGQLVPQDITEGTASDLLKEIAHQRGKAITPITDDVPFEIPESWRWVRLGDISNYGDCISVDVKTISKNSWILELEDLEKGSAKIIQRLLLCERNVKGIRRSFNKGDILYSKLRTYLNKVLVAPEDGYCTSEIVPIKTYVHNPYVCQVLRSSYYLTYTAQLGYGVKMPRLGTNDAKKSFIPLPPLSEQQRIVAKIEELFQQIDLLMQ